MDHIAIMNKKLRLIDKILTWKKSIETRWYTNKISPRDRIREWESVYFKDSWQPVTAKARVKEVVQFEIKNANIGAILSQYWNQICFSEPLDKVKERILTKNYGILIFLEDAQKIKPFEIDKTWFWISCAWLHTDDIQKLIKKI